MKWWMMIGCALVPLCRWRVGGIGWGGVYSGEVMLTCGMLFFPGGGCLPVFFTCFCFCLFTLKRQREEVLPVFWCNMAEHIIALHATMLCTPSNPVSFTRASVLSSDKASYAWCTSKVEARSGKVSWNMDRSLTVDWRYMRLREGAG